MELCENGGIAEVLNVKIYGNGSETLVLAHGFGEEQSVWHFLVPLLAYYFKVVISDMVFSPNVNPKLYNSQRYQSDFNGYADDLVCLVDVQLQLKNSIYLGYSMTAMVGSLAAIKRPKLFNHLVLLNGSPRRLGVQNFMGWVQNFTLKAVGVNKRASVAEFEKSLARMKLNIALNAAKSVFSSDLRQKLPQVKVPCTIIQSKKDYIVPQYVAFYMKSKGWWRSQVKILNTGHFRI